MKQGFHGWVCRALALAGIGLSVAITAQAGLLEDDDARKAILELRQRVETNRQTTEAQLQEQQRKSSDDGAGLRRSLVDLQNQIEALRAELANQRGQSEQQQRDIRDLQRRLSDQARGVDDRLRAVEPMRVTLDGKDFSADPAERRDFEAALAQFKRGDFGGVQPVWVDFIKRYPGSGYRASALFWLGNAQYATRDYKEAIANFKSLIAAEPDHLKVPESWLSIANCQAELKDNRAARKTLEDLVKAYPKSDAAAAARERLMRLK